MKLRPFNAQPSVTALLEDGIWKVSFTGDFEKLTNREIRRLVLAIEHEHRSALRSRRLARRTEAELSSMTA